MAVTHSDSESATETRFEPGDAAAFFRAHYTSLCRLAYLLLGNHATAEEVVMEAFVRAIPRWDRIGEMDRPDAYLRKVVTHLCRSRFRRIRVELWANALFARAREEPLSTPIEKRDIRNHVWRLVRGLPPRQRACVVLKYFEDLPELEIADILGCSVGTVKSQLFKARTKLARELEGEDGGEAT